eukprot:GILI01034748.1.p1 GENE.GILI01034748.1~~GILI01034748.1.p1  ORF type:complete len:212 (+),score=46.11 GILI01034748.1:34-669(+)
MRKALLVLFLVLGLTFTQASNVEAETEAEVEAESESQGVWDDIVNFFVPTLPKQPEFCSKSTWTCRSDNVCNNNKCFSRPVDQSLCINKPHPYAPIKALVGPQGQEVSVQLEDGACNAGIATKFIDIVNDSGRCVAIRAIAGDVLVNRVTKGEQCKNNAKMTRAGPKCGNIDMEFRVKTGDKPYVVCRGEGESILLWAYHPSIAGLSVVNY